MAEPKNNEKQIETRAFLTDERGVSHELKIEKRGDDFALFVEPDENDRDEILISDEEDADTRTRSHLLSLYEDAGANPTTDRLVIIPREDGGWDLAHQAESKACEPVKVLFEDGSDEHFQIERLWMVLGGATDESLNKEEFDHHEIDDHYVHESRALSVLVHGRKNKKVSVDDLTDTLREIEKMVEMLPGDPGIASPLTRRLSEVLSSMATKESAQ